MNKKKEEKKDLSWLILLFIIFVTACLGHFGNAIISYIHEYETDMWVWITITAIAFISLGYLSTKKRYKVL